MNMKNEYVMNNDKQQQQNTTSTGIRDFERWYIQNHYFAFSNVDRKSKYTHTFMNGGVLNVPDDKWEDMLVHLRSDLLKKHPKTQLPITYPISETISGNPDMPPEEIKLYAFVELDAPEEEDVWTPEYQKAIVKVFINALKEHRPNGKHHVYVSTKTDFESPKKQFSNFHIQTKICITVGQIAFLYGTFLHLLRTSPTTKRNPNQTPWEHILDPEVISNNKVNLRMNYASKVQECKCVALNKSYLSQVNNNNGNKISSHKTHKFTCDFGCDRGKILVQCVYYLAGVFDQDGNLLENEHSRLNLDPVLEWKATTIRPFDDVIIDPEFIIPPNHAPPLLYRLKKDKRTGQIKPLVNKNTKNTIYPAIPSNRKLNKGWANQPELPWNSEEFIIISRIIHEANPQYWGHVEIVRVLYKIDETTNMKCFRAYLRGPGSNICLNRCVRLQTNLPSHSSSNTIGMDITVRGWSQWCRAGTHTLHRVNNISCKEFYSPPVPYDDKYRDKLYNLDDYQADLLNNQELQTQILTKTDNNKKEQTQTNAGGNDQTQNYEKSCIKANTQLVKLIDSKKLQYHSQQQQQEAKDPVVSLLKPPQSHIYDNAYLKTIYNTVLKHKG